MTIHREGYKIIFSLILVLLIINFVSFRFLEDYSAVQISIAGLSLVALVAVLQFFRSPTRKIALTETHVLSPADGKVV